MQDETSLQEIHVNICRKLNRWSLNPMGIKIGSALYKNPESIYCSLNFEGMTRNGTTHSLK